MNAVKTMIDNIYIKVSWDQPENNGQAITAYKVLVLASDSLSWLETKLCLSTDYSLVQY